MESWRRSSKDVANVAFNPVKFVREVRQEVAKVTWPSRKEVTNSTTVVIIATAFATIFFALMDQFWLWVTKHVYGS